MPKGKKKKGRKKEHLHRSWSPPTIKVVMTVRFLVLFPVLYGKATAICTHPGIRTACAATNVAMFSSGSAESFHGCQAIPLQL
jgi:hypothetical protein